MAQPTTPANGSPAVVVGLCAHGLAAARALARQGVEVYALEANSALPGMATRCAKVRLVPDINGPGLIDELLRLRASLTSRDPPVLFLTNDNMVRIVAQDYPRLEGQYRLSWSADRENVARLLEKSAIARHCEAYGLACPKTLTLGRAKDLDEFLEDVAFPLVVKPDRPLSSFKVAVAANPDELRAIVERHASSLPVLIQQWIPGDDTNIFFCALYLEKGRPIAHFGGRKLRSRPMGHTTIAEAWPDEEVLNGAAAFFAHTRISGPVSLELKRGPEGTLWVIEPTVGRTDFWLDCCVANGLNLPYFEYCHQANLPLPEIGREQKRVWLNLDRDPAGLVWYYWRCAFTGSRSLKPAFLYLDRNDLKPFFLSVVRDVRAIAARLCSRLFPTVKG
jgi:D-aspartate ligase